MLKVFLGSWLFKTYVLRYYESVNHGGNKPGMVCNSLTQGFCLIVVTSTALDYTVNYSFEGYPIKIPSAYLVV